MDRRSLYARFAEHATDVEGWFFMAEDLLRSAELLEPAINEYWRIEHERSPLGRLPTGGGRGRGPVISL
jgi:hypothetical protein